MIDVGAGPSRPESPQTPSTAEIQRPKWLADESIDECPTCRAVFGVFLRKVQLPSSPMLFSLSEMLIEHVDRT